MVVSLDSDLEQYVLRAIQEGHYPSADVVVRDGLRLLRERDERLSALRSAIAEGAAEADRGELGPVDALATLARVRARRSGAN